MIITFIGIAIVIIIIVIRFTWLLKVECYDDDVCMIIRACAMCAMYVFPQRCATAVCNPQRCATGRLTHLPTDDDYPPEAGSHRLFSPYLPVSWYLSNFALRLL